MKLEIDTELLEKLSTYDVLILGLIKSVCKNHANACNLSLKTISKELRLDIKTVRKSLKKLTECEYITRNFDGNNATKTSITVLGTTTNGTTESGTTKFGSTQEKERTKEKEIYITNTSNSLITLNNKKEKKEIYKERKEKFGTTESGTTTNGTTFQAPSVLEVEELMRACIASHCATDPRYTALQATIANHASDFMDYWQGQDWKRKGVRMKSVKASVNTWLAHCVQNVKNYNNVQGNDAVNQYLAEHAQSNNNNKVIDSDCVVIDGETICLENQL